MVSISPWIILVGGWQLRNYLITGKAEFSYVQGANLLFYRGAGIVAQRDSISFKEAQERAAAKAKERRKKRKSKPSKPSKSKK